MSVMPWPPTRVAQTISCGPSGSWKASHGRLALLDRVAAEDVQRVREALDQQLLHLAVAGEDDERLVGGEEVLDPGQRRARLAARRQPLERVELRQPLGPQRGGDLRLELAEVQRLLAQPGDHVVLGELVLALVVERDRAARPGVLAGSCGSTSDFSRRTKQRAAQVPVDALLRARALEAAGEARAGAELLQAAEDPQLRDQLVRVVHHRRAGQRQPQRAVRQRLRQPPHGLRALGARVLDVVGLVEHERLRAAQLQPHAVRVHDLVVEDRDLGLHRRHAGAVDHRARSGAAASARSRAAS